MTFTLGVALELTEIGKKNYMGQNGLTGSTVGSTSPPAIGVLYSLTVTPG